MAKACPSCGFLNDLDHGACLLCRRDVGAPPAALAFGGEFREPAVELGPGAAAIGPTIDVAAGAPIGAGTPAAQQLLSHEATIDPELDGLASSATPPPAHDPLEMPEPVPVPQPMPQPLPHPMPQPQPARASSRPPPGFATFDPARDASMAAAALAAAGYPVDFTPATLPLVDAYLARSAPRALDPDAVEGRFLVRQLGAYLGELVVRAHGGVWCVDPLAPEATCVSLRGDARFSPFVWLERRLAEPGSEPIAAKYRRVFLGHSDAPPARDGLRAAGRTVPIDAGASAPRPVDDDVEALIAAAKRALSEGRADDAVALATRARTKEPAHVGGRVVEARALAAVGRCDDALARLEAVVRERPDEVDAIVAQAELLESSARFEDALRAYDRALSMAPTRADAWLGKGLALERRGFVDKAVVALHKATQLDPSLVEGWRRMGFGYLRFRRARDAEACFDEVLARAPSLADAHRGRGEALRAQARDDEALAAFRRAAELGDAEAWFVAATIEEALGRTDAAVRAYGRYVADAPSGAHVQEATQRLVALRGGGASPSTAR